MLSEKIQEPLPKFEIGLSQPEKQTLKSFVAIEPIMTNIRAPRSSPVEDQDENLAPASASQIKSIPDSLPVSVIPDSQKALGSAEDKNWKLQSSFDYSRKIDDSEISAGEDTMKDFVKNSVVKEETQPKLVQSLNCGLKQEVNDSNLASATGNRGSKRNKKLSKIEVSDTADTVILVGAESKTISSGDDAEEAIKIQNNFDKQMLKQSHDDRSSDIEIVNEIEHRNNPSAKKEDATIDAEETAKSEAEDRQPIPVEDSPNLSQELEQINHDICYEAPNSPGDVYKSILKDGLKESCKDALSQNNSPAQKKLQKSFKRRLMDTEENYLCSQNSQESPTPSQAKRVPAFARKREVPSLNTSSSFVISKNTSLNQRRKREKSDELVPEEVVPLPPARKSILKKKFLVKNAEVDPTTPKLGTFDFDEKSPVRSDASWMKTEKKKKRTAGFKTKKQRLQEEKAAKRKIKDELKKDQPNKVSFFFLSEFNVIILSREITKSRYKSLR